jgi:hypothetical protein
MWQMKHWPFLGVVAVFLIGVPASANRIMGQVLHESGATAKGNVLEVGARGLFKQSVTENLRLAGDGAAVELETGELYEDDGPAAGHSYKKPENVETLTADTWIKKDLIIPNPQARAAFLVVLSEEPFDAVINDAPQKCADNLSGRSSSTAYAFDPKILKPGRNEIILRTSGTVMIARDDEFALGSLTRTRHPNRSAKSIDSGKTWDYDHLGPEGKLDGEYGVRVFLDHYRPKGLLTTPVLDVGNLRRAALGGPVAQIGPIKVTVDSEQGRSGKILARARSGSTYVPNGQTWAGWQELGATGGTMDRPRGRYVQIALEVSTEDPLQTPRLKSVTVSASPDRPQDWTSRVRVLEEHNEQIVRTSIPFRYEPLDHPHLKKLREYYKLDQLVEGTRGELELLLRLAQWACNYWDWPKHIEKGYPPWDALEILKPDQDGTPVGGFCQQFNLVFLQACESFGFSGRAISISQGRMQEKLPGGGHEVVELWSNEWKKWIYVDGALAWYIVDEQTGTPLSIWELRQRQLQTLRTEPTAPVRLVDAVRAKNKEFGWQGLGPKPQNWYLEMRLIPRSNFLQEKAPLPLNQGTAEWSWTGSYVWTDDAVPAGFLFGNRVAKHSDFEWTLNQAHYVLEASEKPGTLRVHLDTETPSFETYLAELDSGKKKPVPAVFTWKLHRGKNFLRVKPRNCAGREGIASWIAVEYN